ncbi:hypothetical protein PUN28_001366 [Cardiocondyla obscurior]|uniref:Uncharacterized protein n=1 Tax=Cardiocondyla obscurior TaxID=286306 RepID=A0AAW2H5C9_9HYME
MGEEKALLRLRQSVLDSWFLKIHEEICIGNKTRYVFRIKPTTNRRKMQQIHPDNQPPVFIDSEELLRQYRVKFFNYSE